MNDDLSSLFEKFNIDKNSISPDIVNNLMNMLNNSSNNSGTSETNNYSQPQSNNSNSNSNIDIDTILRMKSVIDKINLKDDPRSNLLESLKPYLKESRRNKVDQYVQLMNMSKVMENFNFFNGGNNASK